MIKIEDYKKNYHILFPQIFEMKKLWHLGYYDGPISGVCEFLNNKCYFDVIEYWDENNSYPDQDDPEYEDFSPPWSRRYLIYYLSDEQFEKLRIKHEKFQRMVGLHTDYDLNQYRAKFEYNSKITPETVAQFYKEANEDKQIIDCNPVNESCIIGWYEW